MGAKNRVGHIYGRLTVIEQVPDINRKVSLWKCKCVCGNIVVVKGGNLNSGNTKSCGCLEIELTSKRSFKHGQSGKTPEYNSWASMKARCIDIDNPAYKDYGGRGIKICERWLNSFENFFEDMGNRPSLSHSLDRFPDKNGSYEPSNCRWATKREQAENRRSNKYYEYNGETLRQKDWARKIGVDIRLFNKWIKKAGFKVAILRKYKSKNECQL